jgi:hypothetical protein
VPSRLQLLVVFWGTGAAGICLTQALTAGDRLALGLGLVMSVAACLSATVAQWSAPCRRGLVALGVRLDVASHAPARRGAAARPEADSASAAP